MSEERYVRLTYKHVARLNGRQGKKRHRTKKGAPQCGYVPNGTHVELTVDGKRWHGWAIGNGTYAVGYATSGGVQLTWRCLSLGWAYAYTRNRDDYSGCVPPRLVEVVRVRNAKMVKRFYTMEAAEKWANKQ